MQVAVWALVVVVGFLLSPSQVHETSVVILTPDPSGQVGQVSVATRGGQQLLTLANQMTVVTDPAKPPSPAKVASAEYIDENFSAALLLLPEPPEKFVLYFQPDSTALDHESETMVPKVLAAIIMRESRDIGIHGHADRTGAAEKNLELSLLRAQAIRDILLLNGIPEKSLEVTSHGEGNPLIPTPDGVADPRNRRVEVIVR